jgi:F0F1-type ATP synthase assembly protein I
MLTFASFLGQGPSSAGTTVALLITFLGIGLIANLLIVYIVAQVLAERRQNQRHRQGGS